MSWVFAPLSAILACECATQDAKPQMTKAQRNTQIIARIQAGEKREMIAMDYGLHRNAVSKIGIKAGLPRWSRFKRKAE